MASTNRKRFDPYKSFKFRLSFAPLAAAAVVGAAAFFVARKLSGKRSEVKDSHDRHANIDAGFLRRLRF